MLKTAPTPTFALPDPQPTGRLISVSLPIAASAPLAFLASATGEARIYWDNAGEHLAGIGIAAELEASGTARFSHIADQAARLFDHAVFTGAHEARPRLFGGFAFSDHYQPHGLWRAFASAHFVLPRVQWTCVGGKAWLTLNRLIDAGQSVESGLRALQDEADTLIRRLATQDYGVAQPHVASVHYPLTRAEWTEQIEAATNRIRAGELEKVVLARTCEVEFDGAVDPVAALAHLETRYPDTYRFLLELHPGSAFFGASPELLAEVHGASLMTAALAGSRPRGTSEASDRALADELLRTPKERHEHQLVVDALREQIAPLSRALLIPPTPSIRRLSNIQHLYTPVRAELQDDAHVLHIIERLHPTPALGGHPRDTAVNLIERLEAEPRGWYASPVGWIDANGDGVFAVAIRSAVSEGQRARLYGGCGIVADSQPDREWDESAIKFKPLLGALGVL